MRGWHGNSYAHSLASKGISVRQLKDISNFPETIDYDDPEEFISAFWIASLKNNFSNFDFDKVFRITIQELHSRMNRYGYLSFEDFYHDYNAEFNALELAEYYYTDLDFKWFSDKYRDDILKQRVTYEMFLDVYDIVNKDRGESLAGLDPTYDKLFKIYKEMKELPTNLTDKIILMDKLIDLQHHRGSIWEDNEYFHAIDIEKLRNEFETNLRSVR